MYQAYSDALDIIGANPANTTSGIRKTRVWDWLGVNISPTTTFHVSGDALITGTVTCLNGLTACSSVTVNGTLTTTGNVGIGKSNIGAFTLDVATDRAWKPTTNTWLTGSDRRLKANIELANLDECVNVIRNVPLKRFEWNMGQPVDDTKVIGWIAQDVQQYLPKAVNTCELNGLQDALSLDPDQLIKMMYGALQKALDRIDALETRVATLEHAAAQAASTNNGS